MTKQVEDRDRTCAGGRSGAVAKGKTGEFGWAVEDVTHALDAEGREAAAAMLQPAGVREKT